MSNYFPPLVTKRLLLRPIASTDKEFIVSHFLNPLVQRYLLDEEPIVTEDQAAAIIDFYLKRPDALSNRWVMVRSADDVPLGTCGFHKWSQPHRRAEIGYDLSPNYWGNGYMIEAVDAMLSHGFGALGLQRIEALVAVPNTPSARLLDKLGFQLEGTLRSYYFHDGHFHDQQLFSCLPSEQITSSAL